MNHDWAVGAPGRTSGTVNVTGPRQALTRTKKSSSTKSVPSAASSGASAPSRYTTTACAVRSAHCRPVIGVPAGEYQPSSAASAPVRYFWRRKTGCARRSAISRAVYSHSRASAASQSNQEISLSWQ